MNDLTTLLKQQMESNIANQLDAAVLSGDTATARKVAKQFADLQLAAAPKPTQAKKVPTKEEIMKAIETKAPWMGVDPRKSAQAMELGRMMNPERFDTAEAFADALLKELDKKADADAGSEDDDEIDEEENAATSEETDEENAEESDRPRKRVARKNGTAQTELNNTRSVNTSSNLRRAFDSGDIKFLPKAAADDVKRSADKYAGTNKDLRASFIKNAVTARARIDLIAAGKFDARTNKHK